MAYTILEEDIETYILFGIAPVYFIVLSIIQNRYLKSLKKIENKYLKQDVKKNALARIKKLKRTTPLYLLTGAVVHSIAYIILAGSDFRYGYFISIGFFYLIFTAIM